MNSDRINQIKEASNLAEIVKDFGVSLKASRGKCPFCDSKSSFGVKDRYFTCFKCEAKGDAIEFVRQSQGIGFVEAMKFLGNRSGISTEVSITKAAGSEPKAAAKMYLEQERKLNIPSDWYEQETFGYGNKHTATVRFYLDAERKWFWERYVDGHLFDRNFNRTKGGSYGFGWQPPGQKIKKGDEVYIAETIFDAISLYQLGKKVATALSCHSLPVDLIKKHLNAKWIVAFDGDEVGRPSAQKAKRKIIELGAQCEVVDPPLGADWNDLHQRGKLNDELLRECWWRGQILTAKSARERMAWDIVKKFHGKNPIGIHIDSIKTLKHNNAYWCCELANQSSMDDFLSAINESEHAGVKWLLPAIKQIKISNCTADFLYSELDTMTSDKSYYFRVKFENGSKTEQVRLKGGAIVDQNQFNKALINNVMSAAVFDGNIGDFRLLRQRWFAQQSIHVRTVTYMGFDKKTGGYLFNDFGYYNGRHIKANKLDYIEFDGKRAKSTFKQWQPVKPKDQADWFADFYLAGGNNGLTGLAFWLMSLFAVQVRAHNVSVPFWEFTGIAGSGKSTILDFLWKLVGLEHHEGRDPNKMTKSALGRMFMQLSNMPVVLLEGDRNDSHRAGFDLNHIKTLYAGQNPYGRALFNRGVEIDEPPFYGTIVVSQNYLIEGEEQILSRFVQTVAQKSHFTAESVQAAQRLERLRHFEVVGFLHKALSFEPKIMETYLRVYPKLLERLTNSEKFIDGRVAKNHAQIMAFGKCLQLIVPQFTDAIYKQWCEFMLTRAISRQRDINADHPLVQKFWDIYDTYNEKIGSSDNDMMAHGFNLNHFSDSNKIAINLNHFKQFAEDRRQNIDMDSVRKLLTDSKRHKFKQTKKVNSQILGKVVHCWIFENKDGQK